MTASREHRHQLYQQMVGKTIAGRFKITSLLGFGGMGAVYEAEQRNMRRSIALKVIPAHDPTTTARFKREAMTISQLHHPNTVTVFDYGETDNGVLYLAMEMLSGQNLGDKIKSRGSLTPNEAVHIATQVCRSLSEAHRAKIVHRDIKPDNIFLIRVDDDPNFVKVLDFGIAKIVQGEDNVELTGAGRIIGTPKYMSPEQILGETVDQRSDIYSLGCIVFEMICGTPPFQDSNTTKLMIAHAQQAPPTFSERLPNDALAKIPGPLEQVVRRALAKSPADRYRDTDEFRDALETALEATNSAIRISEITAGSTQVQPAVPVNTNPGARSNSAITDSSDMLAQHSSQTLNRLKPPPTSKPKGSNAPRAQVAAKPPSQSMATPESPSSSKKGPLIAILVALLLIGGLGAYILLKSDSGDVEQPPTVAQVNTIDKPVTASEKVVAPKPTKPIAADPTEQIPASVSIKVVSEPAGARVFEEGRSVGRTPMTIHGEDGDRLDYSFEKDGYKPHKASYELSAADDEGIFSVKLARKSSPKPSRSTRPKPKPTKPKPTKPPADKSKDDDSSSKPDKPVRPNVQKLDDEPGGTTIERLN